MMNAFDLFSEIKSDLQIVEQELHNVVKAEEKVLEETSAHLLKAGGKRLRPAFALLAAKVFARDTSQVVSIAVALELIHMASLVHDDVIDASMTRRGIPTVKANWGNQISMFAGDYIFAKALILIATYNNNKIASIIADVSVKMCQGEIQQIVTSFDLEQNLKDYFYRIKRKTALLISASCACGALAVDASPREVRALSRYGHFLGMAFQITDDILDLTANQEELGKAIGGDLRQGIMTLPIIYALAKSDQAHELREIVAKREKDEAHVKRAIELIEGSGAIEYSLQMSHLFIQKALKELTKLPANEITAKLDIIARYINLRRY